MFLYLVQVVTSFKTTCHSRLQMYSMVEILIPILFSLVGISFLTVIYILRIFDCCCYCFFFLPVLVLYKYYLLCVYRKIIYFLYELQWVLFSFLLFSCDYIIKIDSLMTGLLTGVRQVVSTPLPVRGSPPRFTMSVSFPFEPLYIPLIYKKRCTESLGWRS